MLEKGEYEKNIENIELKFNNKKKNMIDYVSFALNFLVCFCYGRTP